MTFAILIDEILGYRFAKQNCSKDIYFIIVYQMTFAILIDDIFGLQNLQAKLFQGYLFHYSLSNGINLPFW